MESKKSHIVWKSIDHQTYRTVTASLFSPDVKCPQENYINYKTKLFSFLWNNKKDKIKRQGLYQDKHKGGLRMVDTD